MNQYAVSYTHLDVYKRQGPYHINCFFLILSMIVCVITIISLSCLLSFIFQTWLLATKTYFIYSYWFSYVFFEWLSLKNRLYYSLVCMINLLSMFLSDVTISQNMFLNAKFFLSRLLLSLLCSICFPFYETFTPRQLYSLHCLSSLYHPGRFSRAAVP